MRAKMRVHRKSTDSDKNLNLCTDWQHANLWHDKCIFVLAYQCPSAPAFNRPTYIMHTTVPHTRHTRRIHYSAICSRPKHIFRYRRQNPTRTIRPPQKQGAIVEITCASIMYIVRYILLCPRNVIYICIMFRGAKLSRLIYKYRNVYVYLLVCTWFR